MKKESSAGAVIFFQKGKKREYLLLNYLGGHWGFPKGHIEFGENPIKTAIREIKEETGLDVKIIPGFERKITYSFRHKGEFVIKDVVFYLARAKSQRVRLSKEHKGYVWLPYKPAFDLITYEKDIIKSAENFLSKKSYGFTLIEILIVIFMILILFSVTAQIFKPAAYLRKTRDIKRLADLQALDVALKTYLMAATSSNINPPTFWAWLPHQVLAVIETGTETGGITVDMGPTSTGVDEASSTIFISVPFDKEDVRNLTLVWNGKTYYFSQASSSEYFKNNGQGWLPVNLSVLPYPPLFAYPVDPINSYNKKFFYSYVFKRASSTYEINANLEYENYKQGGLEDKTSNDAGDNPDILEIGTDKTLMPNNLY
jgi:prepilin-type N-terminal cleavage/methylation domain-containing protein